MEMTEGMAFRNISGLSGKLVPALGILLEAREAHSGKHSYTYK